MSRAYEKGFNATLFDCIDKALTSVLGKPSVSTFYYAIQERFDFPEKEFPQRPVEVLEDLKAILGEAGFGILQRPIVCEIEETFGIRELGLTLGQAIEHAKGNYIQSSL